MVNPTRIATATFLLLLLVGTIARADRIKDMVDVIGARSNQLVGYGIVVGLDRSGDGPKAGFTLQSVAAMLRRLGIRVDPAKIKLKNVAAVIITTEIPAFTRKGQRLDVVVSSLGDAKSLRGGTLIQTPLRGANRQIYAVAQGQISVGGFSAGAKGSSKKMNHLTVGRIPEGALVEREIKMKIETDDMVRLALKLPDSATASRTVAAINEALEGPFASADDPGLISIRLPEQFKGRTVDLLARVGEIGVDRDVRAKVVINERTGTVVIGSTVTLMPVAIAHGGLTVEIRTRSETSQPLPFTGGETVVTEETDVEATLAQGDLHLVPSSATVGDLVSALNALGVKPADLIVIFQSLASAGALSARIEVQ